MFLIVHDAHEGALPGCTVSTEYSFPSTPSSDGSDSCGEKTGSARWRGGSKVGDKLLPSQALSVTHLEPVLYVLFSRAQPNAAL